MNRHNVRKSLRKLAAMAGLLALLMPCVSVLAGTLSAAEVPICCNTAYCPLHHRPDPDSKTGKSDCDTMGNSGLTKSSLRACDPAQTAVASLGPVVLVGPVALRSPSAANGAPVFVSAFFPYFIAVPLSPPPRTAAI
ncbi:MAG TPA: hypothetical protein VKT71_02585 [Candidatus Acidoferrales bacterium]|nr:hypothetical protein [Candidatus Acidoferrales bacterium]